MALFEVNFSCTVQHGSPHTASNNSRTYNPSMRNAGCKKSPRASISSARLGFVICAFALLCCAGAFAAKEFVMPAAQHARTYPAHDEHPAEKVTIAVDPYDVEYKASIFTVNYRNYG